MALWMPLTKHLITCVAVVVHLYEQHFPDCQALQRLNRILKDLSPLLPVHPSSVSIYRAGELVEKLTPISTQELTKNFEIQHIRELLERCGLKRSSTASTNRNVVTHSVEATHSDCLYFDADSNYDVVD